VLAVIVGIPAGMTLFEVMVRLVAPEDGADVAAVPPAWQLVLLAPAAVALTALASGIPARRAAELRVADALRGE
jgi:ABC-type lipoprotein release transport system permease subunit